MPHKHNADRRHQIAKMAHRVTNWPQREAGLRSRGSLTLWITSEALAQWQGPRRTTLGGQPRYSDLAIETAPMLCCRRCQFDHDAENRLTSQIGSRVVDGKVASRLAVGQSDLDIRLNLVLASTPVAGYRVSYCRPRRAAGGRIRKFGTRRSRGVRDRSTSAKQRTFARRQCAVLREFYFRTVGRPELPLETPFGRQHKRAFQTERIRTHRCGQTKASMRASQSLRVKASVRKSTKARTLGGVRR